MRLIIPKEVEARIHAYTMSVSSEIAGMGRVTVDPDGETITVEEVMIYEQEVTGATADLSPLAIAKWQCALVKAGGSPKDWRLWWHSHDNMAAFFSTTDTDTMDRQTEGDWMVSLVVNKRRERQARLDLYRPFRMYMDKIPVQIGVEEEAAAYKVPADIALEVSQKVKKPAPILSPVGYGYKYHKPLTPPESIERDYGKDEMIGIIKILEKQLDEYEEMGLGGSGEYVAVADELAEYYNELAAIEPNKAIAKSLREKAEKLEAVTYSLAPTF